MAKGQKRSNREQKKPKQPKTKKPEARPSLLAAEPPGAPKLKRRT
jgi:hypothetical protein